MQELGTAAEVKEQVRGADVRVSMGMNAQATGEQTFSKKSHRANILSLASQIASVKTTQLCLFSMKAIVDNM